MIIVYTNNTYKKVFNKDNIIIDVDLGFLHNLKKFLSEFNDDDRKYIKLIDRSDVKEVNGRLFVVSEDGATTINNISTGCKACILANHVSNKLINLTLCGENVIRALFDDESKKSGKNAYLLRHTKFTPVKGLYNFNINDVIQGDLFDLWLTIAEEVCVNVQPNKN